MKAQIISIGNELLIGQVVNTNASTLGQYLTEVGWEIEKIHIVGDDTHQILQCLNEAFESTDTLLTTGGLGPTKDDVTIKAIADYFGVEMEFHLPTWTRMEAFFNHHKYPISPLHREQCYLPKGAEVLENDLGTAPGLILRAGKKRCIVMPGVPYEMRYIMERHIVPMLQAENGADIFRQLTYYCAGVGESVIADHLATWEQALPQSANIAYLPSIGQVRVRLSMKDAPEKVFMKKSKELKALLSQWYFGEGKTSLQKEIQDLMIDKGLKLVTAESCTGGNLAAHIVSEPGASVYFLGGAVTYSNENKTNLLGVPSSIINQYGAVSEEVVIEMVKGALKIMGGDVAVAVSGIAGPDGGSPEKPVGTVWIAVGNRDQIRSKLITFNKDRTRNIEFSTTIALNMLLKFLIAVYLE